MREVWRSIKKFKHYEVSNLGRVRSLPHETYCFHNWSNKKIRVKFKGKILSQSKTTKGYLKVGLPDGNHLVHTLVLVAFRGPRPNGKQGRHLNGNKTDARLSNLSWGTPRENNIDTINHGKGRNKVIAKQVRQIRRSNKIVLELAKNFKIKQATVYDILANKTWDHVQ